MSQPNCLLILTDHWRGDCLGRLGHPAVETPHLDSLSAGGTTYTQAFSPCPSCVPARRSLMTGLRPGTHGMVGYEDGQPWPYLHTLAGEMTRAGYQTLNIGKTHFHPPRMHLGFEQLVLPVDYEEEMERVTGLVRPRMVHGVHGNSWIGRPHPWPETQLEETWLVNQAMLRLRQRDPTRPFFLCLSFNGPHPPWCPPQFYYDLFIAKTLPAPKVGAWAAPHAREATYPLDVNAWRGQLPPELVHRARAAYYAYLAYIDAQIGRFLEFLGRAGWLDETLIAFTSDHGEMLGDHHLWRKSCGYDPSVRVPLIMRPPASWPGPRNREVADLVGLEDLMPTFLAAAGADVPPVVEGHSLADHLRGADGPGRTHYHHEHAPCYAPENAYQGIVTAGWKYLWNPITGAEQVFDRQADPDELHDLSDQNEVRAHRDELRGILARELAGRPEGWSDGTTLRTGPVAVWRDPRP